MLQKTSLCWWKGSVPRRHGELRVTVRVHSAMCIWRHGVGDLSLASRRKDNVDKEGAAHTDGKEPS